MSTSNSTDYTENRDQIIFDALWRLGVVRTGGTVSTNDYTRCSAVLNNIVKHIQKTGLHVWAENEGTVFLLPGQAKYTINGSSNIAGDDTIGTVISADSSGTTLTVTSTQGMTANDKIGIELNDGTRQWTTITTVNSTTTLTLNASLTDTAASGNTVFTYTTTAGKPINISSIQYRDSNNVDIPLMILGRDEYMEISDKTTTSTVITTTMVNIGNTGTAITVWPVPEDCTGRLVFTYSRQLQDFDSSSDTPDFPSEWLETLTLTLMAKIYPAYGVAENRIQRILADAERSLLDMKLNDLNNGSIKICPQDRDMY